MSATALELTLEDFEVAWMDMPGICDSLAGLGLLDTAKNYGYLAVVDRRLLEVKPLKMAVVFEHSLNRDAWPEGKHYDWNARAKALMAARDKTSTRMIVRQNKQREGDFAWPGGIYKSDFGVGFSGMAARHDELVSRIFLALAISHAYEDEERNPTIQPAQDWVGGEPRMDVRY